jgi:hypothetical protein
MRKVLLGILGLLALSAAPLAAYAQMPGEKCDLERLGTTKRATDDQNIIACLKTGEIAQNGKEIAEWKAMTSSGGGTTGGCFAQAVVEEFDRGATRFRVSNSWGKGCSNKRRMIDLKQARELPTDGELSPDTCKLAEDAGYSCGITAISGHRGWLCQCAKK